MLTPLLLKGKVIFLIVTLMATSYSFCSLYALLLSAAYYLQKIFTVTIITAEEMQWKKHY